MRWMKIDEACRYAGGVSRKTLYGAIRARRLQAGRIGAGRNLVVSDAAIDRWLEDLPQAPTPREQKVAIER